MELKQAFKFLSSWVALAVIGLIVSYVLPGQLTLGNNYVTRPFASIILGFFTTAVFLFVRPSAKRFYLKIKDEKGWTIVFLIANSLVIWILKRLASITGIGVSNIIFVLILSAVLTASEYFVNRFVENILGKK